MEANVDNEKTMYINKTLGNYIKLMREDENQKLASNNVIADAMVGLYYARQEFEGDKRILGLLEAAESAVTELHFLHEQMRVENEE